MNKEVLDFFKDRDVHDAHFVSFTLNTDKLEFSLHFLLYDEDQKDYASYIFKALNFGSISIDSVELNEMKTEEGEIHSFEAKWENEIYKIDMIIIHTASREPIIIKIRAKEVLLEKLR